MKKAQFTLLILLFPLMIYSQNIKIRGDRQDYVNRISAKDSVLIDKINNLLFISDSINKEILSKFDSISMNPNAINPLIISYLDNTDSILKRTVNYILINDSLKYFIYGRRGSSDKNDNEFEYGNFIIKNEALRFSIAQNIVFKSLNNCNFFNIPELNYIGLPVEAIKTTQKMLSFKFKRDISTILYSYKNQMQKIYNSKKGSECYLKNLKVILDYYKNEKSRQKRI